LGRGLGSQVLSFLCRNYFTPGFSDTQCGIKAFRAKTAKDIFSQVRENRFSFDVEVLFLAIRKKLIIKRIPVKVFEQTASTVNIFRDGMVTFFSLLNICANYFTGKYKL
jgi:dolichyl-phosphate beta-glucosyltransferase